MTALGFASRTARRDGVGIGDVEVAAGEGDDVVPAARGGRHDVLSQHPRGPGDQEAHRREPSVTQLSNLRYLAAFRMRGCSEGPSHTRSSSPTSRPQRQRQLEAPSGSSSAAAEQLAQLAHPVAHGLRVHVERGGDRLHLPRPVEPRPQRLLQPLARPGGERVQRRQLVRREVGRRSGPTSAAAGPRCSSACSSRPAGRMPARGEALGGQRAPDAAGGARSTARRGRSPPRGPRPPRPAGGGPGRPRVGDERAGDAVDARRRPRRGRAPAPGAPPSSSTSSSSASTTSAASSRGSSQPASAAAARTSSSGGAGSAASSVTSRRRRRRRSPASARCSQRVALGRLGRQLVDVLEDRLADRVERRAGASPPRHAGLDEAPPRSPARRRGRRRAARRGRGRRGTRRGRGSRRCRCRRRRSSTASTKRPSATSTPSRTICGRRPPPSARS